MTIDYSQRPINMRAGRLAQNLNLVAVKGWEIQRVVDEACAISVITVCIVGKTDGTDWIASSDIRMIYSEDDNHALPRGSEGGKWLAMPMFLSDVEFAHIKSQNGQTDDD